MDQFYDLAVKCVNDSMSKEELIPELRGGGIEDWVGAFRIIIAIIVIMNNAAGFQILPNRGAIVHPNGAIVRPENSEIQGHLHHPKGGGRIRVRMSKQVSTNVIPTQTQV